MWFLYFLLLASINSRLELNTPILSFYSSNPTIRPTQFVRFDLFKMLQKEDLRKLNLGTLLTLTKKVNTPPIVVASSPMKPDEIETRD